MREAVIKLSLQRMVDRTGKTPVAGIDREAAINGSQSGNGRHRCSGGRAIRTARRADKIEWIWFLGSSGWCLLADVVSIVDGQVIPLAAHISDLCHSILSNLLLDGHIPKLRVGRSLVPRSP